MSETQASTESSPVTGKRRSCRNDVNPTKRAKPNGNGDGYDGPDKADSPKRIVTRGRSADSRGCNISIEVPKSRGRVNIWSPAFLLSNPKSKLATCNISELVSRCAWEMLSQEDQAECITYLLPSDVVDAPADAPNATSRRPTRLVERFFEENPILQDDIHTFQTWLKADLNPLT